MNRYFISFFLRVLSLPKVDALGFQPREKMVRTKTQFRLEKSRSRSPCCSEGMLETIREFYTLQAVELPDSVIDGAVKKNNENLHKLMEVYKLLHQIELYI